MASPRILIGIPALQHGGFRPFDQALHDLVAQRSDCRVFYATTGVLPGARNRIVREALRVGAEYVWFLDDDQPFFAGSADRPSDLDALLAHQLDAVIPLSPRRGAPFLPLLFRAFAEDDWLAHQIFLQPEDRGLLKITGAGMAGLLITTAVLRRMGTDGWFAFVHPADDWDNYSEDFPFYKRLVELGVDLYCDLEVRFGHAVTSTAYIVRQRGQWVTALADSEPFVMFPQAQQLVDGRAAVPGSPAAPAPRPARPMLVETA